MPGGQVGSRRVLGEAALLGLAVGLLVVAPWMRGGYLVLLDWVSGPEQALTPGVYGLSGSALDAMPFRLATQALREMVGPAATAWLVILAYFPLAAAGAAAAAGAPTDAGSRAGDSPAAPALSAAARLRLRMLPAALLMVVNPFVIDRVRAGHVAVLLGLAILPWLFRSALHARRLGKSFAVRPALWYALAMSISPHMAWLGGLLLLIVGLLPAPRRSDIVRTVQVTVTAGLVYGYALVLYASGTRTMVVTRADLDAYATATGPGGWLPTVLSLHGFWRSFDESVRSGLGAAAGLLLLVAVLTVVVAGLARASSREPDRGLPLIALTVLGLLLGAGVAGPLAGIYRAAFDALPLFEAMREQQKWLALAVVGYAVGFGWGVELLGERIAARRAGRWSAAPVVLVGLLPLAMAPWLLWGLGATVQTSTYPASWQSAEAAMGPGEGTVLFLPWHAYQPFDFTRGRTVATPAAAYFSRPTLVSDAVELPGLRTDSTSRRTAYVDQLVAGAGLDALGPLLAPLGVEYVVVAASDEDLAWVGSQPGLEQVLAEDGLVLYRVTREATGRVGPGARVADLGAAAEGYREGWGSEAVLAPDADLADSAAPGEPSLQAGGITKLSPTRWQVEAGPSGWVVVPEEYATGWDAPGGQRPQPTLAGTVALPVGPSPVIVEYAPWRLLAPALVGSLAVLLALVIGGLVEHRRELRPTRGAG